MAITVWMPGELRLGAAAPPGGIAADDTLVTIRASGRALAQARLCTPSSGESPRSSTLRRGVSERTTLSQFARETCTVWLRSSPL
jgi:hypothetical protein